MDCPYCVSKIADTAVVCPVCRRDLFLLRPLIEKVARLESELANLRLREPASADPGAGETAAGAWSGESAVPPAPPGYVRGALAWLAPVLLLLLAHWLIIFVYDAKVLYLRLLALAVPLPFGLWFGASLGWRLRWTIPAALAMAGGTVFAMSALTGLLDGVPILPQNMVEVREFLEFAASIAFSFITGLWLQAWRVRREAAARERQEVRRRLGDLAFTHGQRMADSLSRLNDIGSAVVGFATTAFSIYTGLKGVLGN